VTRVLVPGGAGFVGANLCLALAAAGEEVVALDSLKRNPPAAIAAIDPEGLVDPGGQDVNAFVSERNSRLKYDVGGAKVWLHPKYAANVKTIKGTP
jgi:nucleoside-diphosphate-sugar epimerase